MKIGARNRIIGEVKSISKGQVMCLKKGDKVEVIVKAVHVLLVKH